MTIERRTFASDVEHRSAGLNRRLIIGYAYKFRSLSRLMGGFREQILEGAGAESIRRDDIRALLNHDANFVLGRNTAGTLKLAEDSTGLHYEIQADERISYVSDLLIALERGDITHSSFGFRVNAGGQEWAKHEDGFTPLRSINSLTILDVSPVTYPAYLSSESSAV
ncbi:HK97 family phage prohead protease [Actinoplanes subglobosus]|uniref:HK97 family phage prohead protease n=1 Tax=Actinoplanes subglobosus TaxID=1547892 RepID=A0ABV8IYS9_9ACTN